MVDFDGKIACTVFTGGCNFRCPFCHNAPLVVGNVKSQQIDCDEVFDYLQKRKGLVDAVCVTGGEPTLQPDLCDFLAKVRDMGYATKLDTNGLRPDVLKEVLDKTCRFRCNGCQKQPRKVCAHGWRQQRGYGQNPRKHAPFERERSGLRVPHDHNQRVPHRRRYAKIAYLVSGAPRYFMQKYNDNDGCIAHGYTPVDKADAEKYIEYFKGKVGKVELRGYK